MKKTLLLFVAILGISLTSCKKDYPLTPEGQRNFIINTDFRILNAGKHDGLYSWQMEALKKYRGKKFFATVNISKAKFSTRKEGDIVAGYEIVDFVNEGER